MITASICADISNIEATILVFAGNLCGALASVAMNNSQSCGGSSSVTWSAAANTIYYILVIGTGPNDIGNYKLTIGIENNICGHAIMVDTTGMVITGLTEFANQEHPDLQCFGSSIPILGPSLWYAVIGTKSLLEVTTCHLETEIET